jgi:hypothetical protein
MKLGSETNSLVNHLYSRQTRGQPEPVVGMGATLLSWTDRHAATIVSVEKLASKRYGYLIGVCADIAKRVDGNGMSEDQTYEYSPGSQEHVALYASKVGTGEWVSVYRNDKGRLLKHGGGGLRIGSRETYHDFSF